MSNQFNLDLNAPTASQKQHAEIKAGLLEQMARLTALIEAHGAGGETVHYGHVGSLARVGSLLTNAENFLSGR